MEIERINPKGLFVLDAFSQVVRTRGGRLAFIAGQGAFDEKFKLVLFSKSSSVNLSCWLPLCSLQRASILSIKSAVRSSSLIFNVADFTMFFPAFSNSVTSLTFRLNSSSRPQRAS